MNINLFKSVAARNGCNMKKIAEILNVTSTTLSRKIAEKQGIFTRKDFAVLLAKLDITPDEMAKIFFAE